jgi:SAM-dependent methyltransferase
MFSKLKNIWNQRQAYMDLLAHWGLKYKCPICGFHSKDFSSIGIDNPAIQKYQIIGAGKRNAGCPKCGSSDRDRLIYTYLKYEQNIFENHSIRVLHIAPEMIIAQKIVKCGFADYQCGDFFAEGQHANYSHELVKHMDVQNLPYTENTFDLVICNHVLEHVYDEEKGMKEIHRVLCRGGTAILQVPISPILEKTISDPSITDEKILEERFGQKDHVRLFGMDYASKLESCGFVVETVKLQQKYPKFGLNPKEILFIGRK